MLKYTDFNIYNKVNDEVEKATNGMKEYLKDRQKSAKETIDEIYKEGKGIPTYKFDRIPVFVLAEKNIDDFTNEQLLKWFPLIKISKHDSYNDNDDYKSIYDKTYIEQSNKLRKIKVAITMINYGQQKNDIENGILKLNQIEKS